MPPARHPAATDVSGRTLTKGDTVATLNGQMTGRVWETRVEDDGTAFVQVRPVHQPYAQAVWYSADQLIWVATPQAGKKKDTTRPAAKKTSATAPPRPRVTPAKHK